MSRGGRRPHPLARRGVVPSLVVLTSPSALRRSGRGSAARAGGGRGCAGASGAWAATAVRGVTTSSVVTLAFTAFLAFGPLVPRSTRVALALAAAAAFSAAVRGTGCLRGASPKSASAVESVANMMRTSASNAFMNATSAGRAAALGRHRVPGGRPGRRRRSAVVDERFQLSDAASTVTFARAPANVRTCVPFAKFFLAPATSFPARVARLPLACVVVLMFITSFLVLRVRYELPGSSSPLIKGASSEGRICHALFHFSSGPRGSSGMSSRCTRRNVWRWGRKTAVHGAQRAAIGAEDRGPAARRPGDRGGGPWSGGPNARRSRWRTVVQRAEGAAIGADHHGPAGGTRDDRHGSPW